MRPTVLHLFKSILHNLGVTVVSLGVAQLGRVVDGWIGLAAFGGPWARAAGVLLLLFGFLIRVWATTHFYAHAMRVISLVPQGTLVTSGPFRFSRNPLYLGGNVFMFFGAAMLLGSPSALVATALHLPLVDRMIRREEKQLQRQFGEAWQSYAKRVRRWL